MMYLLCYGLTRVACLVYNTDHDESSETQMPGDSEEPEAKKKHKKGNMK